jgi:hypothetical protein
VYYSISASGNELRKGLLGNLRTSLPTLHGTSNDRERLNKLGRTNNCE